MTETEYFFCVDDNCKDFVDECNDDDKCSSLNDVYTNCVFSEPNICGVPVPEE